MQPDPFIISAEGDFLTWVMILDQLDEAHVHLGELVRKIHADQQFDEVDVMVQLGHIYGHLNRFWHGRKILDGNFDAMYTDDCSAFPDDVILT